MTTKLESQIRLQIQEFRQCYGDTVSIEQLSILSGVNAKLVRRLVSFELIEPVRREREPEFRVEAISRIRKLMRLHHDLGVSWSSMGVVLDLLDRVEKLKRQLGS